MKLQAKNMATAAKLKITLKRSLAGQLKAIRSSVRGLGLRRIHQCVVVAGTPENLGMINAATHMLKVEKT
jgi:large subunit ribosomal protein L30